MDASHELAVRRLQARFAAHALEWQLTRDQDRRRRVIFWTRVSGAFRWTPGRPFLERHGAQFRLVSVESRNGDTSKG